ncbi:beta-eliminating lyase [Paraburkholderia sp. BL21I4N1]|nr:beta-eliminating lyase [Paraburkholderia sp. BL21I4N1]
MQHLASDTYAGIRPGALDALIAANHSGHEPAYGEDSSINAVCDRLSELFPTDRKVFNGTAADSRALASPCQSYHPAICHELAHIETDECGGPAFFLGGSKPPTAPTAPTAPGIGGKCTPDAGARFANAAAALGVHPSEITWRLR